MSCLTFSSGLGFETPDDVSQRVEERRSGGGSVSELCLSDAPCADVETAFSEEFATFAHLTGALTHRLFRLYEAGSS